MLQTLATVSPSGRIALPKAVCTWLRLTPGARLSFRPSGAGVEIRSLAQDEIRVAALQPVLALIDAELITQPDSASTALPREQLAHLWPATSRHGAPLPGAGTIIQRHGWRLAFHALVQAQVTALSNRGPAGAAPLQALGALMLDRVPGNPMLAAFSLKTIPGWRRAHCATGRFSVLFRADPDARVILFAWLDDGGRKTAPDLHTEPCVLFGTASTITPEGHTMLPLSVRERLGVAAGGQVQFGLMRGALLMRAQTSPVQDNVLAGLADLLDEAAIAAKPSDWSVAGVPHDTSQRADARS